MRPAPPAVHDLVLHSTVRTGPSDTRAPGEILLERTVRDSQQRPGMAGGQAGRRRAGAGCEGGSVIKRSVLVTASGSCRRDPRPLVGEAKSSISC